MLAARTNPDNSSHDSIFIDGNWECFLSPAERRELVVDVIADLLVRKIGGNLTDFSEPTNAEGTLGAEPAFNQNKNEVRDGN